MTSKDITIALMPPPITTVASGRWTSAPMPVLTRRRNLAEVDGRIVDVRHSDLPPRGPETKVCAIEAWKKTGPTSSEMKRFALVRLGPAAILRQEFTGGWTPPVSEPGHETWSSLEWEPIGSPGDTDDSLLDQAMARLAALAGGAK